MREGHAFEGRPLAVISRLKRRGEPTLLLELPDGSRTYIPVAWTDLGGLGVIPQPRRLITPALGGFQTFCICAF